MKMMLYVQRRKNGMQIAKPVGVIVEFDFQRNGDAICFSVGGDRALGILRRAKLDSVSANGMTISGLEGDEDRFTYQEWWLTNV